MEQLTKNVFVDTKTRGSHHGFIVTSQGLVLVDVPVDPGDAVAWAKEAGQRGKIRYIINTEFHMDHCLNNQVFGGVVIASKITSDLIREVNNDAWLRARTKQLYVHPLTVPSPEEVRKGWPAITFSDRMDIRLGDHTIQIMLLPGHTPGQTAVYVPEEKVLFVADNLSKERGASLHDALPDRWLDSLETYRTLDARFIVTGHTGVVTSDHRRYLDQQASVIREHVEAVRRAKFDRLSVDEAAERIEKMFPRVVYPASQDFAPPVGIGATRRWVSHIYHVTGGNVSECPMR
jgi:cyclase